jgi:hypothetical protein
MVIANVRVQSKMEYNNKNLAQVEENLKTFMIMLERARSCNDFGSTSIESAKFDIDNLSRKVDT